MIVLSFKKEIKGDATAAGFVDQIVIQAVSFGASRAVTVPSGSTARETGVPSFSEISCTKEFDIASTELFMQSISGASLEEGVMSFLQTDTEGNPQLYLEVTLTDPIVTSFSCSSGGAKPHETFTLNFTKIKMAYTQYSGEAAVKASPKGWDLLASKAA